MANERPQILDFIRSFFYVQRYRRKNPPNKTLILEDWHKPSKPPKHSEEPIITWIGHSTFLIQIGGINIITDPIFFDLSVFFPRVVPTGIPPQEIPPIDVLLVSHDHRDHFEKRSLKMIATHNPAAIAPKGLGKRLQRYGFKKIKEHDHGDKCAIETPSGDKIVFTFLPTNHWSGCNIFNIGKSKHGSWMIEYQHHTIYFAGDTAYSGHFSEIGQEFKNIDTAIMPVGPIEPRYLIAHAHIDAIEAVKAFLELNARQFIPMHWGTFQLGADHFDMPIQQLKSIWKQKTSELVEKVLRIVKFGAQYELAPAPAKQKRHTKAQKNI
jgi:L-ascorbate metabolism protein UlaG (beta-lactamase superfamily)